jgi:response regulator RpfG family c-di-GMP phosphodiesterase
MSSLKRILTAFRRLLPSRALKRKRHSYQRELLFSESEITLVALVLNDWNRTLLARIAKDHRWSIHFARTSAEAWELLNERQAQIFLFEREAPGMDWRGVIRKVVSAPRLVCAILISDVTDGYLWNEVVMWGGHDVLVTPLREENVLRAVRLARLYWNSAMKTHAGVA